ncbi:MAG: hypothetical protein ACOCYB_10315, partial [Alkalispirochaeta sp.]
TEWYLSIGRSQCQAVVISPLTDRGRRGLYARRFEEGGIWIDLMPAPGQLLVLREDVWIFPIEFSDDRETLHRYGDFPMHYRRRPAHEERREDNDGRRGDESDPYAGEWEVDGRSMRVAVRPLEAHDWEFLVHFPGDPLSGIRRGTYPFYRAEPGVYRSSRVYSDSYIELTYEEASETIKLTPQFSLSDMPAELTDPVRLWPACDEPERAQ